MTLRGKNPILDLLNKSPEAASKPDESGSVIGEPPALVDTWPSPMDEAAFHGPAGEFVRRVLPHSEADAAALLTQFLVAVGCRMGRGPYCRIEEDRHGTAEFVVVVGDSAVARKGTSWGRVERFLYDVDVAINGVPESSWAPWCRTQVASGLSSAEGLVHRLRDKTNDDPGADDKRLLVVEGEFGSVLRQGDRQGNTLSS